MKMKIAAALMTAFAVARAQIAKAFAEKQDSFWNGRRPSRRFRRSRDLALRDKPWPIGQPYPGERALYRHGKRLTHSATTLVTNKRGRGTT